MKEKSDYKVVINSGIPLQYIQTYSQSIAFECAPLHFRGTQWEAILMPISQNSSDSSLSILIPRTEIHFIGERDAVEKIVSDYRLEFLSAGG